MLCAESNNDFGGTAIERFHLGSGFEGIRRDVQQIAGELQDSQKRAADHAQVVGIEDRRVEIGRRRQQIESHCARPPFLTPIRAIDILFDVGISDQRQERGQSENQLSRPRFGGNAVTPTRFLQRQGSAACQANEEGFGMSKRKTCLLSHCFGITF
ncbi:MAG: hypothetical protein HC834_06565 [Rhodospirillales bacterium]|nr:hypothetical protein [Rhodospirillales bacterium]